MPERDKDQEQEQEQRDALCPACGQGFKFFVDRLLTGAKGAAHLDPPPCPHCGCQECRIK